jgi:hypothetical protein
VALPPTPSRQRLFHAPARSTSFLLSCPQYWNMRGATRVWHPIILFHCTVIAALVASSVSESLENSRASYVLTGVLDGIV